MLITDEYLKLNAAKHVKNEAYGIYGGQYAPLIQKMCDHIKTNDVLDYGCGKAKLQTSLPFEIKNYDPAIPKFSDAPEPADIVVCTDVLEHIEPECLMDVLGHLRDLCKKAFFFTIATRPSVKVLDDGSSTHRIIEAPSWWIAILLPHFMLMNIDVRLENGILVATGIPKYREEELMGEWKAAVEKAQKELHADVDQVA